MKNILAVGALALAVALAPQAASAAPITGSISFSGAWSPTGGTGISDATGVDISSNAAVVSCAISSTCTGTYSGVTGLVGATYNDFDFAPLGGSIAPLWTLNFGGVNYSFDLASVVIVDQLANFLSLTGEGTLKADGYDDTIAQWSFSGDTSGGTIAFSATNSVPEPAMLVMLGFGLIGVGRRYMRR